MENFQFDVWPTQHRRLTQQFGANPTYYGQFGLPGHDGVDIDAPHGSPIFAVAAGVVATNQSGDPHLGQYIQLQHQGGYQTTYAHLSQSDIAQGDRVEAGTRLGLAGDSGNTSGGHLHFGLQQLDATTDGWPDGILDPTPYLLPLLGWQPPVGPALEGWILSGSLYQAGQLAQAHLDGARFWTGRNKNYWLAGGTLVELPGVARSGYTLARVTYAALGIQQEKLPLKPNSIPQPTVATLDGWVWETFLQQSEEEAQYAVVGWRGVNLRRQPYRASGNIGLIRPKSTVLLLPGNDNRYQRVRVLRSDFDGPINLPVLPPLPHTIGPLPGEPTAADELFLGWVNTDLLELRGAYARVSYRYGAALYPKPISRGERYAIIKGFAMVALAGATQSKFAPVLVQRDDLLELGDELPKVTMPNPLSAKLDPAWPQPPHDSTPAWMLTGEIEQAQTRVGRFGTLLHVMPQRDADILARALPFAPITILGEPEGEFMPVRVPDTHLTWLHAVLTPPDGVLDNAWEAPANEWAEPAPAQPAPPLPQPPPSNNEPASSNDTPDASTEPLPQPEPVRPRLPVIGTARIGLHASADPLITDNEIAEFALLKPGVIKVSSFHNPDAIDKLAKQHPQAAWIVRAFLEFGGRDISPAQFVEWTLSDMRRSLAQLHGKEVVIELHNEPNLYAEGLGRSWANGAEFDKWWLDVLQQYRSALPQSKFIYPGLSPGHNIASVRLDHIAFLEASRRAVNAADGLGVHIYWGDNYPMARALRVLDDYLARVPNKTIWITEASNNSPSVPHQRKGTQYIQFWQALQKRSRVGGVTYFVASSSNPKFAPEAWVGNGIAQIVGNR